MDEFTPMLWVQAAQRGDLSAVDQLFRHFGAQLRKVARAARWNGDAQLEVSDIVQTTLRRAFESLPELDARSDKAVAAWFRTILDNAAQDVRRKAESQRRSPPSPLMPLDDVEDEFAPVADGRRPQLPGAESAENNELVLRLSSVLDEQEFRVLALRALHEDDWLTIAREIGAPTADAARKRFEVVRSKAADRMKAAWGGDDRPRRAPPTERRGR